MWRESGWELESSFSLGSLVGDISSCPRIIRANTCYWLGTKLPAFLLYNQVNWVSGTVFLKAISHAILCMLYVAPHNGWNKQHLIATITSISKEYHQWLRQCNSALQYSNCWQCLATVTMILSMSTGKYHGVSFQHQLAAGRSTGRAVSALPPGLLPFTVTRSFWVLFKSSIWDCAAKLCPRNNTTVNNNNNIQVLYRIFHLWISKWFTRQGLGGL